MARVSAVEEDQLPEAIRPIYRRFGTSYGPFLNQARVFAHRPVIVEHLMALMMALADEAVVPKRLLEIALITVSRLNACTYCVVHHDPRAIAAGLAPDTVARILEPDCPGLDPVDRLVRDYAVAVTEHPGRIGDDMFSALHSRFSEAEIVELTFRIALCGFFNRFNDALQIDIEGDAVAELLARGGRMEAVPNGDRPDRPSAATE